MNTSDKTASRYNFDQSVKASDREWQAYRLTAFNERTQVFVSKMISSGLQFEDIDASKNLTKDTEYVAPHLKVGLGVIRPVVLTVGDPFRCLQVAELCDESKEIEWNREYRIFNVTFEGKELSVVSHGIGGPGAAICFEELIKLGATTIIRLGTCGSL